MEVVVKERVNDGVKVVVEAVVVQVEEGGPVVPIIGVVVGRSGGGGGGGLVKVLDMEGVHVHVHVVHEGER